MVGISRAMIFWHPDIEAKIIGPSTTNLVAGAKYPLVVSIINKDTWFSEDGKDPKIFVDVTGAVIVKAESAYFTSISPSNIPAEGVSHVEFSLSGTIKKNTLLSAVIIIKVQPGTVTIKVKCQAGDFDGWPDSPTQESESTLTYQVTSLMPGPLMFADLADYRSQCAIDYANLYKDFILYGKPFQTTSRDKLTQDMVNSAKQAGELLEWTEIALNWIMDPAAGLFSAFAKMIGDVTGMPSLMSILDFATLLLERADRELKYFVGESYLANIVSGVPDKGTLENYYDLLVQEKEAWKSWDFNSLYDILWQEKSQLNKALSDVISDISTAEYSDTANVQQLFKSFKVYIEQETKTVEYLQTIVQKFRSKQLDLIFVIDVTGSMWDDIDQVKASAGQIVNAIDSKIAGYRIAVVSYRDFPVSPYGSQGDWPYKDVLGFSTEKTKIIEAIQSLVVGGGADWQESVYSALMHAIDASSLGGWRTGANKFIILMGDAPPHDPEPFTGYTLNDVIKAAEEADPVAIYPIVIGADPNTYTYFSNLAENTHGKVFTAATASEVPDTIIEAIEIIIDTDPPSIRIEVPQPGDALQDGVTFKAIVSDSSGVEWVTFSIREPNGELGSIIDPIYESMPATHIGDDTWQLLFDTTQLPDGYYILLVNASDTLGNEGYATAAFSIRNWAVLELLPASPSNKAGRTMPVKFALRVDASVDPNQPFVYNEELTIIIYATDNSSDILQISKFGDTARDYRINTTEELYITNFQTLKTPKTYMVEIWRKNMLIGSFSFQTVK
jgi:hypothetical protein